LATCLFSQKNFAKKNGSVLPFSPKKKKNKKGKRKSNVATSLQSTP
jgi:hypothetical protein